MIMTNLKLIIALVFAVFIFLKIVFLIEEYIWGNNG